jgi:hypothetical protein
MSDPLGEYDFGFDLLAKYSPNSDLGQAAKAWLTYVSTGKTPVRTISVSATFFQNQTYSNAHIINYWSWLDISTNKLNPPASLKKCTDADNYYYSTQGNLTLSGVQTTWWDDLAVCALGFAYLSGGLTKLTQPWTRTGANNTTYGTVLGSGEIAILAAIFYEFLLNNPIMTPTAPSLKSLPWFDVYDGTTPDGNVIKYKKASDEILSAYWTWRDQFPDPIAPLIAEATESTIVDLGSNTITKTEDLGGTVADVIESTADAGTGSPASYSFLWILLGAAGVLYFEGE